MVEAEKEFKHIVRIANTDLIGDRPLYVALKKIKGVGFMFANAICVSSKIDRTLKTGYLNEKQIEQLSDIVKDPQKHGIPIWALNRKKNPETGEDKHLVGSDLRFQIENDIKLMRKIKSYRGMRHAAGLPVRGQKTKNNFRKSKGKGLGVARKKKGGRK